jgi:thioredoxin 1
MWFAVVPAVTRNARELQVGNMITVTDMNFEADVRRAELPVLLDLWAPWCKPCVEVDRVLDELATDFEGKLLLAKANVADCRSLPRRLGVLFVPTLILFVGGNEAGRTSGVPTRSELLELTQLAAVATYEPKRR